MDERLIFWVDDGAGARRAYDPFRVERLLAANLGGDSLYKVIADSRLPVDKIAAPALERLLAAASAAFGLPPLAPDGSGFTERARLRVLADWVRWREAVKKNTASPPTSSPATGPRPKAPSSTPASATNSSTRSG